MSTTGVTDRTRFEGLNMEALHHDSLEVRVQRSPGHTTLQLSPAQATVRPRLSRHCHRTYTPPHQHTPHSALACVTPQSLHAWSVDGPSVPGRLTSPGKRPHLKCTQSTFKSLGRGGPLTDHAPIAPSCLTRSKYSCS